MILVLVRDKGRITKAVQQKMLKNEVQGLLGLLFLGKVAREEAASDLGKNRGSIFNGKGIEGLYDVGTLVAEESLGSRL